MKYLLTILFSLSLGFSFGQKPFVGAKEQTIKDLNSNEFDGITFYKEKFEEFWVLISDYKGIITYYYFEYGRDKNILCSQFISDFELAKELYVSISENKLNIAEGVYYDERLKLYIHLSKAKDNIYVFTWSKIRLK